MKQTRVSFSPDTDLDNLINLMSASHLLKEKTRISLYLPKAEVKIMDAIAKNQSRSELVKTLVVEKAKKARIPQNQNLYGIFANAAEEFHDIDKEVKKMWDESLAP